MTGVDAYGSVLARAVELAVGAGDLLMSHFGHLGRSDADRKHGFRRDLVSRADYEAEAYLLTGIPPEDAVLSEESGTRSAPPGARLWVVDPLDGTVNFLHGLPLWAVSIGVAEQDQLVAAVVHAPALGLTFTASAGGGAFLGEQRIAVSRTTELGEALLATGFAYARNEVPDDNLDNFRTLALAAADVRRIGSAALDLAWTAAGRLDAFWELHLAPWDLAAGTLLVREAGGRVSDFHGREELERLLYGKHLIASNGPLHPVIASRLEPLRGL